MAFLFCQGKGLTMSLFAICVYNGVTKGGKKGMKTSDIVIDVMSMMNIITKLTM